MPYGHGHKQKTHALRMLPLILGEISAPRQRLLDDLRRAVISACTFIARGGWVQEPLLGLPDDLPETLRAYQKQVPDLNQGYAEKARLAVTTHLTQQNKLYFKRLYGRLLNCENKIPDKKRARKLKDRIWWNVPKDIQEQITQEELDALAVKAKARGWNGVMQWFRDVCLAGQDGGLTPNEQAVLKEIHRLVQAQHTCPEYGKDPRFVCQIHLDARLIRDKRTGPVIEQLQQGYVCDNWLLVDEANRRWRVFLEISNPAPGGLPIRLPIALDYALKHRLDKYREAELVSLVLEIGAEATRIKACLAKPKQPAPKDLDLNAFDHIIGIDFGYCNTIAVSVVKRDQDIDPQLVAKLAELDDPKLRRDPQKLQELMDFARHHLGSHHHPKDGIVLRFLISGAKFMRRVNRHCEKIDRLKSEIDHLYNHIEGMKVAIAGYLGLQEEELIPENARAADPFVQQLIHRFFKLLKHVRALKAQRRRLYRRISGLKKSWFGHISRLVRDLAKQYNAFVVRESLDLRPEPKLSPKYKGPTFQKMVTNGSCKQYQNRQTGRLQWDGVPEVAVPAPYTSCTCILHALVDETMRDGARFRCPRCGRTDHADNNASDTMAYYLLLRPNTNSANNNNNAVTSSVP